MHRVASAAIVLLSAPAWAQVIVPNALANAEGNFQNSYPFGAITPPSQRIQQVYAAAEFSAISAPRRIMALRFRPDAALTFPAWSNDVLLQVRLSTTAAGPDAMSLIFANNTGPDEALVYAGPATIATQQSGPAPGPQAFDVVLTLQTPFPYNPAAGNLLLDVVREGSTLFQPRFLDAENTHGDGVSRVYTPTTSTSAAAFGVGETVGLVTSFTFEGGAGGCYPNCDGSTATPVLNVQDFTCFLQRYAAGSTYANCDSSTAAPVLNVQDFTCFLQRYAAGCP